MYFLKGPDFCHLWLLVATFAVFGPELACRLRVAEPTLTDICEYLDIVFILTYILVYYSLIRLHFSWLLVLSLYIRRIIYILLNGCHFDYTASAVSWKVGFNHTSLMTVVTATVRLNSVRNYCLIEVYGGVSVLSFGFFWFSVGIIACHVIGLSNIPCYIYFAFVIGPSQLSFFFSLFKPKFRAGDDPGKYCNKDVSVWHIFLHGTSNTTNEAISKSRFSLRMYIDRTGSTIQ